jgi:hypothetical protein
MSLIPTATITINKFISDFTGQFAHASAGYIAINNAKRHTSHRMALLITGVAIAAAAFKEFYWDYKYEDAATRGSSVLDFSMYMVGIVLGWLL